ncbi:type II toxin-antitoxin system HicB family antitoxin [Methylosinus sp. KRF6]|uniref:type II toxin-antitoxin system HicB family antitoxin n=1 Tax=Methylosinus sp. KRF6 TaxID=2846853 RepID=UPI001C0DD5C7|nr:type II toxin-antitoxin system HicB family antitoxin [Methylosinus sp. KRF6]
MSYAIAVIHEEQGVYGISFPDFPGCVSTGCSLEEAMTKGGQALALHVSGMVDDCEPLPQLRGFAELRADPELAGWFTEAIVAAVFVDLPRRAVKVNVSIDEGLLEQVDRAAETTGLSRSAYFVEAAKIVSALQARGMSFFDKKEEGASVRKRVSAPDDTKAAPRD